MKRLLVGMAGAVLLVLVLGVGALLLVDADHLRPQVQATLGHALGREVTLGKLHASVWSGSLHADEIRIGDDPAFGKQPFVSAQSLQLGVRLLPLLLHRQLRITSLTLDQPSVRLLQDRAGRWNFASLGGATAAAAPPATSSAQLPTFSVDKLRIKDGRIDMQGAAGDVRSYQRVQVSADHVGPGAAFPLSMSAAMAGGGTLQLDGQLGPWNAVNAVLTPLDAHLVMHDLDLVGAGLMSRGDGVGGVLDVDTRIHSQHGVLQSKGRIDARQLKLMAAGAPTPQPVRIDHVASYQLDNGRGRIEDSSLALGATHVAIVGSFDNRPKVMQLDLHIHGKRLPVDDVQPLLPVFGVVLPKNSRLDGGSMDMDLHAQGPARCAGGHRPGERGQLAPGRLQSGFETRQRTHPRRYQGAEGHGDPACRGGVDHCAVRHPRRAGARRDRRPGHPHRPGPHGGRRPARLPHAGQTRQDDHGSRPGRAGPEWPARPIRSRTSAWRRARRHERTGHRRTRDGYGQRTKLQDRSGRSDRPDQGGPGRLSRHRRQGTGHAQAHPP